MPEIKAPPFRFAVHGAAAPFSVNSQTYLLNHPDSKFKYMATGAVVFDDPESKDRRILLLQRSANDSWPSRWEIPGGACDDDDESILHGVARELWEESGLVAAKVGPVVGGRVQLFVSRSGKEIGKFVFFVIVKSAEGGTLEVKLNPDEHQRFVWANEAEVRSKKAGDIDLEFTTADLEATVLRAFELRRNEDS
jgi:8-oxo-dGTP pyrophosphatase MutT (NUDIX family)